MLQPDSAGLRGNKSEFLGMKDVMREKHLKLLLLAQQKG